MSDSHRRSYRETARGGLIALGWLCIALCGVQAYAEGSKADRDQQRANPSQAAPEVQKAHAQNATPAASDEESTKRNEEIRTLVAAEKTANYTRDLADTGRRQTWLIGAQAAFLGGTLFAAIFIAVVQLRAYVFIEDATIKWEAPKRRWEAIYIIKNNGITPAHKVKVVDKLTAIEWEPKGLPKPDDSETLGSIGPGGDSIEQEAYFDGKLEPKAFAAEEQAIMLIGRVTYQDMFNFRRRTDFCFYVTESINRTGERMSAWNEGNDST